MSPIVVRKIGKCRVGCTCPGAHGSPIGQCDRKRVHRWNGGTRISLLLQPKDSDELRSTWPWGGVFEGFRTCNPVSWHTQLQCNVPVDYWRWTVCTAALYVASSWQCPCKRNPVLHRNRRNWRRRTELQWNTRLGL